MRTEIRFQSLTADPELRGHVQRRIRFALSRFSSRLDRVIVRLEDVNGPRGGVDKVCRIRILGRGFPETLIEERGGDIEGTVDRAADRAGRTVGRALDRSIEVSAADRRMSRESGARLDR